MTIGGRNETLWEGVKDKDAYVYKKLEFLTVTSKLKYCTKEWERQIKRLNLSALCNGRFSFVCLPAYSFARINILYDITEVSGL
jgi:hypothetical protein